MLRICPFCNTEYTKDKRLVFAVQHSYCRGCATSKDYTNEVFTRLTVTGFSHVNRHAKRHWFVSCSCGSGEKTVAIPSLLNGATQSCGCLHKESVARGKNHPYYNPSISEQQRDDSRKSSRYENWKRAVSHRDGYACVLCGEQESIHVHHLYSFTEYPEYRYDIDNGVILCTYHHRLFHKQYGLKSTLDDYYEFVDDLLFD